VLVLKPFVKLQPAKTRAFSRTIKSKIAVKGTAKQRARSLRVYVLLRFSCLFCGDALLYAVGLRFALIAHPAARLAR
ncbi:MAG: hypothetical protein RSC36_03375, partial [Ruthenibacterium sp.]